MYYYYVVLVTGVLVTLPGRLIAHQPCAGNPFHSRLNPQLPRAISDYGSYSSTVKALSTSKNNYELLILVSVAFYFIVLLTANIRLIRS